MYSQNVVLRLGDKNIRLGAPTNHTTLRTQETTTTVTNDKTFQDNSRHVRTILDISGQF